MRRKSCSEGEQRPLWFAGGGSLFCKGSFDLLNGLEGQSVYGAAGAERVARAGCLLDV